MINLNNLTERQRNIASIYFQANDLDIQSGMTWYDNAHSICQRLAARYGYTTSQVAGVMAALSPGCSWEQNVKFTEKLISYHKDGLTCEESPKVGTYGKANKVKAWKIADGAQPLDVLGGNKVRAFFACIDNPQSKEVCIDRHAASIAVGKPLADEFTKVSGTDKKYASLVDDYNTVAYELQLRGHQLQAITWVAWRRIHNGVVDSI